MNDDVFRARVGLLQAARGTGLVLRLLIVAAPFAAIACTRLAAHDGAIAVDKLEQTTQVEAVLERLQTTLAAQRQNSVHLQQHLRSVAIPDATFEAIGQAAGRSGQQIKQASQRGDLQLALQRTALSSKSQTINKHASRHKGRMILFSAFEVKAVKREKQVFPDFSPFAAPSISLPCPSTLGSIP